MAKIRIFELAKDLGVESKKIITHLLEQNVEVKNHMSSVDEAVAEKLKAHFDAGETGSEEKPVKEAAPRAAAPKADASKAAEPKAAAVKTDAPKAAAPKTAAPKAAAPKAAAPRTAAPKAGAPRTAAPKRPDGTPGAPPKKKKLIHVFRPQNSDNESVRRSGRPAQGGVRRGRPTEQRQPGGFGNDRRRPIAGRPMGPAGRRHVTEYEPEKAIPRPEPKPVKPEPAPEEVVTEPKAAAPQVEPKAAPVQKKPVKPEEKRTPAKSDETRRAPAKKRPAGAPGAKTPPAGADMGNANKPGGRRRNDRGKKKDHRDDERPERELRGRKGKNQAPVLQKPKKEKKQEEVIKMIEIPDKLTLRELAEKMKIQPSEIIKKLFMKGEIVTLNTDLSYEQAEEIALEYECLCEHEVVVDEIEELLKEQEDAPETLKKRPPVVCVMGHVDHGKTSILDAVRKTNVTDKEAGGITQHIGASVVRVGDETITFLDTPGHEAFTAMRMRGANSTDIAVLVVAADDGVMPQTVEAINHAKAAGVEVIVAINKIDRENANIDRVKKEMAEHDILPEDWGGKTIFVPVSAKTGEGISDLMDMIVLTAEMLELKANPDRKARGLILEARLDKGKGSVANMLVQKGTLHTGDIVAAGSAHGRVRAMTDSVGRTIKEAGPSTPVSIIGLNDVPEAGEVFVVCKDEKEARSFSETFIAQHKADMIDDTKTKMTLDDLFTQIKEGDLKELNIVVKADVQGSVEALSQSLVKLSNDEVAVKVIHGGVGAINESDAVLASASNAIIIGFNVRPDAMAKDTAQREGVDMRLYRVIYDAIDDVEAAMKGMLAPEFEEKVFGHAEVRQLFKASGIGTIAGCYVTDGTITRDCKARVVRDGIVVYEGEMTSLKRFKDDVKEVKTGFECGIVLSNYNDIKESDQIEAFKMVEKERS